MKKLLLFNLALFFLFCNYLNAQTYTWNVANGTWSSPSSWSPARSTPDIHDTLIFNGSVISNPVVTGVTKDSIARISFINNVQVTISSVTVTSGTGLIDRADTNVTGTGTFFTQQLIPGDGFSHNTGSGITEVKNIINNTSMVGVGTANATGVSYNIWPRITILDSSANSFMIASGSKLTISGGNPHSLSIYLSTNAKAQISGSVEFSNGRHKFFGADSNCVVFKSGASLTTRGSYNGSPFGLAGRDYIALFENGSSYLGYNSTIAFGLSASTKVTFAQGSRYVHKTPNFNTGMFNGRDLGTLVIDTSTFNQGAIPLTSGCTIDSLVINSATLVGFNNSSPGSMIIRKALVVNNGTVSFGTGSATQTIALSNNSNTEIGISGNGTLTFGQNANLVINNPKGVRLSKSIQVEGTLTLNDGIINMPNTDTLTLGSAIGTPGTLSRTAGHLTGNGSFKRWMGTSAITLGQTQGLFPMGTTTDYRPFHIGCPITSGGVVLVRAVSIPGTTVINPAFADSASNQVMVNLRQNSGWMVSNSGFGATTFSIMGTGVASANEVTDVTAVRLVLDTSIAPGDAQDGSGTVLLPEASRINVSSSDLNNTFYLGSNSTVNTLPVTFINVSAEWSENGNMISWSTASESNLVRFEVEKSVEGSRFQKIDQIKPMNTRAVSQYRFMDEQGGTATYRIKAVNLDGSVQYSNTFSVIARKEQEKTILFPNPVVDYIQISQGLSHATIRLYNSVGKEMAFSMSDKGISTSHLVPGIYYLHLSTSNSTEIVKFVKKD